MNTDVLRLILLTEKIGVIVQSGALSTHETLLIRECARELLLHLTSANIVPVEVIEEDPSQSLIPF